MIIFKTRNKDQSELKKLLLLVNPGDQIFVTELSRLARNLSTLVQIGNELRIKGVNLHSLKENINTTTPTGVFIYQIFSCFYEFERNLISERTKRSLEFRRARGFKFFKAFIYVIKIIFHIPSVFPVPEGPVRNNVFSSRSKLNESMSSFG
jgi:DNA invertase Pin-like site-specific DNA recombinase